ncbi:MAG: glycosyltransferase family 2 protein [Azospirillaceae bacterium]|nr:glycosyltransferase family 2 protein [Azospirillaceae bacterium]
MPNYNDSVYIEASIKGIFRQTRRPDAIIFVDDASTDNSLDIVRSLDPEGTLLRIITKPTNKGVVDSFNIALAQTTTDYVNFVSMDDSVDPTWIEKSMAMLEACPNAGICFTDLYHDYGDRKGPYRAFISDGPCFLTPEEFANKICGHYISGTSVVVKTDKLLEVGGYRPELRWHSDWFAWLAIACRYGTCFVPECLVSLKVRDTSHSTVGMQDKQAQDEVLRNIMLILNSDEFADIVPQFVIGQVLRHWSNYSLIESILRHPELMTFKTQMLVNGILTHRSLEVEMAMQERGRRSQAELQALTAAQRGH